ncbi:hypothetical protein J3F84DRAFT_253013 [Trichoderma pleuroticola]
MSIQIHVCRHYLAPHPRKRKGGAPASTHHTSIRDSASDCPPIHTHYEHSLMPLASAHSNSFTHKVRSNLVPVRHPPMAAARWPPPLQQVSQTAREKKTVGAPLGESSQLTFTKSCCPSAYRTRIRISCLAGVPRPAFGLLTLRIVPGLVCRLTLWDHPLMPLVLSCFGPVRVPASFLQLHTGSQ